MITYVLDTNIISLILRKEATVAARLEEVQSTRHRMFGCPAVWYEVRRGLLYRDSKAQMSHFFLLFDRFEWQDYTVDDWRLAAEIWANLRANGRQIADADLLIAVFALNRNAILVTDNEADFAGISVTIENWKKTPPLSPDTP